MKTVRAIFLEFKLVEPINQKQGSKGGWKWEL